MLQDYFNSHGLYAIDNFIHYATLNTLKQKQTASSASDFPRFLNLTTVFSPPTQPHFRTALVICWR